MKVMKYTVVLSLLLTLAGGALTVRAEDEAPAKPTPKVAPAPPPPKKPIRQTLTGKVIALDRYGRTVTLQVNNLTYVLQITDSTRLSRGGEPQNFAEFVIGEEITVELMLRELNNGRVEVAVLSVELPQATTAQGRGRIRNSTFAQPPPFQNGANPANVDGPVISRSR